VSAITDKHVKDVATAGEIEDAKLSELKDRLSNLLNELHLVGEAHRHARTKKQKVKIIENIASSAKRTIIYLQSDDGQAISQMIAFERRDYREVYEPSELRDLHIEKYDAAKARVLSEVAALNQLAARAEKMASILAERPDYKEEEAAKKSVAKPELDIVHSYAINFWETKLGRKVEVTKSSKFPAYINAIYIVYGIFGDEILPLETIRSRVKDHPGLLGR